MKTFFGKIIRLTGALSALAGTVLIIITSFRSASDFYILAYFTMQANILVLCFFLIELAGKSFHPAIHGALTLYILITGLVYNTMLAPYLEFSGIDSVSMVLTHTATPLLFIADYIFNRKRGLIEWRHLKFWLIYPTVYLVESSIEGAVTKEFRYPFLDFINNSLPAYLIQLGIVIAAFILFGCLIILLDRKVK